MSDMSGSGDVVIPETQAATEDKKHEHHLHSGTADALHETQSATAPTDGGNSNGQAADSLSAPHVPHHALHKPSSIVTQSADPIASASPQQTPENGAALPTSSSFNAFSSAQLAAPTSPPQSPTAQPFSPLPPVSSQPPPPPSRPWSHRLVDYFLVIGRQPPKQQSLVPMRRLSRSNSQTVQPISDLSVLTLRSDAELPEELTRLTDFANAPVNVNAGFMRTPTYVCESRRPKQASTAGGGGTGGASLLHPITGIDVLYVDKKEGPRQGFVQLSGNINRGSFKGSVAVAVERDSKKSPIIDIKIISAMGKDSSGKEREKEKDGKDGSSAAAEKPAEETCPSDYTLVDKILTSHKGRDYYICYKVAVRRAVEYMAYEAFVLDRYPPTDHFDQPLEAQGVAMLSANIEAPPCQSASPPATASLTGVDALSMCVHVSSCFPRGMILSGDMAMPSFMTFVITQADGSEMYGAALIFYELITDIADVPALYPGLTKSANGLLSPPRKAGDDTPQQVWCPKCLCLLSHHPYYDVFKSFLNQLYRIAVSPSSLPIERYIANFFYDVPVPTPLFPVVRFQMGHEKLSLRQRLTLGLPHQHVSLMPLFKCLSVPNIVLVFQHVLAEGKLVLVSSSYTLLTPVAEAIRALQYPFKWQNVFIPILPTNLAYTIRAPVPFIVGLHRSFMDEIRVPAEVMQVDLDRDRISVPAQEPDAEKPIQPLPAAIREQLEAHLASFVDVYRPPDEHSNTELDSYTAPLESTDAELATFQELNIRLTFMRVIIRFIGEYRRYCILREEGAAGTEDDFDLDRLFDRKAFLASFPSTLVDFARQLTDTQGFSDFVLNRVSWTNRMEELLFFDYCCSLTREEPAGKKKDALAATDSANKPGLARTQSHPGVDSGEKRRFGRNRTLTEIVQPTDLYRTGSLTIEKIEEFSALTPSVTPFLYTPGHEKPYIAPGPDESDCPPALNYASFPHLDLERFPASARALLAEQQAYAVYMVIEEKRKAAEKKAAKAAALQGRHPQTPLKGASSASSTPVASPIRTRVQGQLTGSPIGNGAGAFAFQQASAALTTTSLQKIVMALYTLLNSLNARSSKGSAEDRKAMLHCAAVYETWFTLFVSEVEKERARRIETVEEAKFARTTDAAVDPLSAVPDRRLDAFSPISSVVHLLPPGEVPVTLHDLLSVYTELHTMVYKGSVLPTELILQDVSLFCLRAGLTREFQELYRLLSTSVPFPTVDFFVTLAKVGVSVLPGNPCSVQYLAEREREAKDKPAVAFDFPTVLETQCVCSKCGYTLSGEEIYSGWLLSERLQTACPLCETAVSPSLLVTHGDKPAAKFDFLKTSQLRSTLHTMAALAKQMGRAEVDATSSAESTTEVQDLGDSGSIDLFAGATGDVVSAHDYIATAKEHPFLFWNVFWFFTSRGLQGEEYGQLPFHFLFGEPANAPTWEQPQYVFSARPYRPWRVYQEGCAAAVSLEEEEQRLPAVSMSAQSSRSVSPSPPMAGNGSLLNDRIDLASRTFGSDDADPASTLSATSSANASPQINGHRLGESDELLGTATSVSLGPAATEADLAGEDGGEMQDIMSPMSLTSTGLVASNLTVSVDGKDAETDSSATSSADPGKISPSSPSSSFDSSASASIPLAVPGSSLSASSRRDVKSWPGIVGIMLAPAASSKQKAVPRAVHEILRVRKARKAWSKEQRETDAWSGKFGSSMYRQLSLLLQDTSDPLGFAAEYRSAIQSLNALIETHKKAVQALDANIAQQLKSAEKSAGKDTNKDKDSSSASEKTISGSPPTAAINIRSPSSSNAPPSHTLAADAASSGPGLARSPSSTNASLASLLSPSSAAAAAAPSNLDPDVQREVDAARKKRSQLIATLQEAISLRSEMLPSDQPPIQKYVQNIPAVRHYFAHDASVKSAAAVAGSGADANNAYASLVEDVLLNETPALEDVLSQSSQNPYYSLDGLTKFCAKYVSREEREAADKAAKAAATSTSAPPSPSSTSAAPGSSSSRTSAAKPQPSLAYKYCAFWQTARRWKYGYEKQEKQRSISMAMKKDQQEMIQDVLYDTAKAIYLEYLAPINTPQQVKKPPSPANPAASATATTEATGADSSAATPPPVAAATAASTTSEVEERKDDKVEEKKEEDTTPATTADGDAADPIATSSAPALAAAAAAITAAPATAPAPNTAAAKPKAPPAPVVTVAGFTIDGAVWAAMKASLGDVQPSLPRPSTPTGSSGAGSFSPTHHSSLSNLHAASANKSTIAATLTRRRVPKTLFDEVLVVALSWLQRAVFDEWVLEVKEAEHNIVPSPLQSLTGHTGLHQNQSGTAGQGPNSGKGKPPTFGKSSSSYTLSSNSSKGKAASSKK